MTTTRQRTAVKLTSLVVALLLALTACGADGGRGDSPQAASLRTLTDMQGREVEVPQQVDSVVTLGSVPVINSFLFALGKGESVVNGLPDFALNGRWKYQYVFAPNIENQPQTQNADNSAKVEEILKLEPDVVLTMSPDVVKPLEAVGLKVIVLKWRDATDVKQVVSLLGTLMGEQERAAAYSKYFDSTLSEVQSTVAKADQKRTALYLSPTAMTRPHLIADWWIGQAGGTSVTAGSTEEVLPVNIEQIITWNPDVLFVSSPQDVQAVYADARYAPVAAVARKQVFAVPIAAHTWGNRTSEQPLTVYWAASKLYPDLISNDDLLREVNDFYDTVYGVELTDDQVAEIASGKVGA